MLKNASDYNSEHFSTQAYGGPTLSDRFSQRCCSPSLSWIFFCTDQQVRPECVFSMSLVSFFLCKSMRAGEKKNTKCRKKHKISVCHPDLPGLGAYSYERTNISFTVLGTLPNNNYCIVSHYSLLVGSNVIHVCFTGSLSSLCFESIIMLSLLPLLLAPTRATDRMHDLVFLQYGSRYCRRQRTLAIVATHIADLRVSAPG